MKEKVLKIICLLLIILPINIKALEYPEFYSEKVLVYDLTDDNVLYSIKEDEESSIASLTKIMTTIVAIENIRNLSEKVTITSDILSTVRWDASVAGLKSGDRVTYEDLLYASMLPSGADATNALAIITSGSVSSFVSKMNLKAKELGMDNTMFVNVTGLDAVGHHSTLNDLLKLLKYSLNNDLFKTIYTSKTYTLSNGLKVESTVNKYNRTLGLDTSKILGSKTGFTKDAGLCIAVYFQKEDHDMLLITLDAETDKNYNLIDALSIIDFVDNNYGYQQILDKNYLVKEIPVVNSDIDTYEIKLSDDVTIFLNNDYDKDNIKIIYDGLEELSFRNKENDKIGTIKVYYEDKLLRESDVIIDQDININILKVLNSYKFYIFGIIILFILIRLLFKKKKRRRRKRK